jgi:hypothetical protein
MSAVVQEGKKRQVSRTKGQERQTAPRSCLRLSRRERRDRSVGLKVRGDNPRLSQDYKKRQVSRTEGQE